jgi:hypothetical protein
MAPATPAVGDAPGGVIAADPKKQAQLTRNVRKKNAANWRTVT